MTASAIRIDKIESGKNLAINGNFDLWQRGTSFSSANNIYTADRFHWKRNGTSATQNITQDTDVPTAAQSGFQSAFSWLMTQTSTTDTSVASTQLLTMRYYVEGYDYAIMHGGSARVQFWMKASLTGNYAVAFINGANNRSYCTSIAVNSANTWELKTIDVALDTGGSWSFDNSAALYIHVGMMVGASFKTAGNTWTAGEFYAPTGVTLVNTAGTNGATVRISQYMIVPGSFSSTNSLVFNRAGKNISEETRLCQRYCWAPTGGDSGSTLSMGQCISSTRGRGHFFHPVDMRTAPTIDSASDSASNFKVSNSTDNAIPSVTSYALSTSGKRFAQIDFDVASGLTSGDACKIVSSGAFKFILTAE